MSPSVKRIACSAVRHFGVRRRRNSRSMPKCLNSSSWALTMIAFACGSGSREMRCSYQPIASASSVSDAIIRANVLVSGLSSEAGSWYCSKPISLLSRRSVEPGSLRGGEVPQARRPTELVEAGCADGLTSRRSRQELPAVARLLHPPAGHGGRAGVGPGQDPLQPSSGRSTRGSPDGQPNQATVELRAVQQVRGVVRVEDDAEPSIRRYRALDELQCAVEVAGDESLGGCPLQRPHGLRPEQARRLCDV